MGLRTTLPEPFSHRALDLTWFCATCITEYQEPYCASCGQMLTNNDHGGAEAPARSPSAPPVEEEV